MQQQGLGLSGFRILVRCFSTDLEAGPLAYLQGSHNRKKGTARFRVRRPAV